MVRMMFLIGCLSVFFTGYAQEGAKKAEAAEVEICLVKNAVPNACIVIAKEAGRSAQFAASELQYHIQKITGATVPVVTDDNVIKGTRILVGDSKATQALGLRNNDFKPQEYLIQFLPDTLVLMGRDNNEDTMKVDYSNAETFPDLFKDHGTCYAVYDFLERFCGIRWYLPTELGLVCPQKNNLVVKGTDMRRSPAMKYREIYSSGWRWPADLCDDYESGITPQPRLALREAMLFSHRQRLGGEPHAMVHSFYGYYTKNNLEKHRDWFAKGYDKDMPADMIEQAFKAPIDTKKGGALSLIKHKYYPHMCYTNEEFIAQVIKSARSYFDGKGVLVGELAAGDFFSLSPNDSLKYCTCPKCMELRHSKAPCDKWREYPFFWNDSGSDYIFNFVNKVSREIHKTHPDKFLSIVAYNAWYYPPTREKLEPNVAITMCLHSGLCVFPAMDKAVDGTLNKWDEESKERPKYVSAYYHRPSTISGKDTRCFPGFMAHDIDRQMKRFHKFGIRGIFVEPSYGIPIMSQLELYVLFKLADDPTLDGDKLIDEFFRLYYGSAAEPMQQLYEKIEQTYCNIANYPSPAYLGYQTEKIAWENLGTEKRMVEFGDLMAKAMSSATTDTEKKRVSLFEKAIWQNMKAGRDLYQKKKAAKKSEKQEGIGGE